MSSTFLTLLHTAAIRRSSTPYGDTTSGMIWPLISISSLVLASTVYRQLEERKSHHRSDRPCMEPSLKNLQLYYNNLGPSLGGGKYEVMLSENYSSYVWFFTCPDTTAENAARAIVNWSTAFGMPKWPMFEKQTHFINETVHLAFKLSKDFTHRTIIRPHAVCRVMAALWGMEMNWIESFAEYCPSCNYVLVNCRTSFQLYNVHRTLLRHHQERMWHRTLPSLEKKSHPLSKHLLGRKKADQ